MILLLRLNTLASLFRHVYVLRSVVNPLGYEYLRFRYYTFIVRGVLVVLACYTIATLSAILTQI